MEIYKRIGERIRNARLRAGLTQPQLAQLLDVSKGIISRWETGYARPSLDRLEPLAQRLGVSVEVLLGFAATEETGTFRARSLAVWEIGLETMPDFKEASSIGEVIASEQEALAVQAAVLVKDDCFLPHFVAGDVIGLQTKGRPRVGDVLFLWRDKKIVLYRYAGRRKNEILIPVEISKPAEYAKRLNLLGVFRWLHRPGHIIARP